MYNKSFFPLLLFILLLTTGCLSQEVKPTKTESELEAKLQKIFDESNLPGLSVSAFDDTGILFQKSFGESDLGNQTPYSNTTVQTIGSTSKTFIAVALMIAQEQGKLGLQDPINKYLPFEIHHPKFPNTPITIEDLARHSSGIEDELIYPRAYVILDPDYNANLLPTEVQEYFETFKLNQNIDLGSFLKNSLASEGKWFSEDNFGTKEPGKSYSYSNVGSALAAYVLENATGMAFYEFTQKYIFAPLQMTQSSWDLGNNLPEQFATRYLTNFNPIPQYKLITYPDGGVITSSGDFGLFMAEMMKGAKGQGTLLSKASYEEMFSRKVFGKESSGIFWEVSESGVFSHTGSDLGVLSLSAANPDRNAGAFLMTNIMAEDNEGMVISIREIWNTLKAHQWK